MPVPECLCDMNTGSNVLKKDFSSGAFLQILKTFLKTLFYRIPPHNGFFKLGNSFQDPQFKITD